MNSREEDILGALTSLGENKGASLRHERKPSKEEVSIYETVESMSDEDLEKLNKLVTSVVEKRKGKNLKEEEERQKRVERMLDF